MLAGVHPKVLHMMKRAGLDEIIGQENFFWSADRAILVAEQRSLHLATPSLTWKVQTRRRPASPPCRCKILSENSQTPSSQHTRFCAAIPHEERPMTDQPETAVQTPGPDAAVTLRTVTSANVYAVLRLRTTKAQEQFVATNAASLAEAAYNRRAWPRAIYADETPVGFVMLYDDPDKAEYFLWRLMVDQRYQRLGFGRRAPGAGDRLRSADPTRRRWASATTLGKVRHSPSMRSLALWKRAKW